MTAQGNPRFASAPYADTCAYYHNHYTRSFKQLFAHARREVSERFPEMGSIVVGFFFFLRFLCPCIVTPFNHGLTEGTRARQNVMPNLIFVTPPFVELPSINACRALLLVSKVLQNLANMTHFEKEEYMVKVNNFIAANQARILALFGDLSVCCMRCSGLCC